MSLARPPTECSWCSQPATFVAYMDRGEGEEELLSCAVHVERLRAYADEFGSVPVGEL